MRRSGGPDDIAITKEVRARLRAELRRTGATAIMLLSDAADLPDGIDARAVNRWMNGLVKTVPQVQLDYVLARWAALPAAAGGKRGKSYPAGSDDWIEVTDALSAELRAELVRTGLDHATLLDGLAGLPAGLNARIVKGWLYGQAATTRAAHWAFVTGHLASLTDLTTPLPPLRRGRRNA